MRKIAVLTLSLLLPACVLAAEPTDASVKSLLELSGLPNAISALSTGSTQFSRQVIDQASKGHDLTDQQKKDLDGVSAQFSAKVQQDMAYDKLLPGYTKIYKDAYSQEEVDGLIAFFKTPAGVAYLKKMPQVMQKTQDENRSIMVPMMQKLQADVAAVIDPKK